LHTGGSDACDDLPPAAAGLETACDVPHKGHGYNHLSLKSSEVDVSCGLIPLAYSEPAELTSRQLGAAESEGVQHKANVPPVARHPD